MRKLGLVFCVVFLLFAICMPVQAQPLEGEYTSDSGDFDAGDWQEILWGTGEGKRGNEIEAGSADYFFDAAFLDTVTLIKEPGSPPDPPNDYFEYETFYVGGTVLLFNSSGAPWNNPLDPNAVFIVDLEPTKVVTKKFVDDSIEFTLTATGKFRHYDDLFADIKAVFEGDVSFVYNDPVIMYGELDRAEINIRGPLDVPVHFDVKPGSCPNPINPKSKGVLPAAILGSSDFDVTTIDPASVRLRLQGSEDGVAPIRWALEDVATPFESPEDKENCFSDCNTMGRDGYTDITFKFDTQEVIAALGDFNAWDCLVLEVVGNLKEDQGGGTILGEDVVRMLKAKPYHDPSPKGKWNKVLLLKAK